MLQYSFESQIWRSATPRCASEDPPAPDQIAGRRFSWNYLIGTSLVSNNASFMQQFGPSILQLTVPLLSVSYSGSQHVLQDTLSIWLPPLPLKIPTATFASTASSFLFSLIFLHYLFPIPQTSSIFLKTRRVDVGTSTQRL